MATLALSMCAMVAASATAGDGGSALIPALVPAAAQVERARAGAVDVASDAIEVAQTVQAEGAQVAIDAEQLQALEAATTHLDALLVEATGEEPGLRDKAVSRSAERGDDAPEATAPAPVPTATAPIDPLAPIDPASVFEQTPAPAIVPLVPPAAGKEDETTAELREAVAAVATLTTTVRLSAEAKRVADAAAAAEAAAAAAAAQAAADAAAQAAAEQAAQRAAWKESLRGYANGKIPESALCGVSFDASVHLRCDAAEQLDILNTAYRAQFGSNLVVNDSYRSYAGQLACKRTKGYLCATPGTSNHGSGVAVDLGGGIDSFGTKQHRWMAAHARDLSWGLPSWASWGGSKPEPWHWEYLG